MREMIFNVPGMPQGKARPRFSGLSHTVYTPDSTHRYEKRIRDEFLAAGGGKFPEDSYLAVRVVARFPIPKSYSKAKARECFSGIRYPTRKPDADNILKAVLDALNGAAYEDDRQVVETYCLKCYDSPEGDGFISVQIREVVQ